MLWLGTLGLGYVRVRLGYVRVRLGYVRVMVC